LEVSCFIQAQPLIIGSILLYSSSTPYYRKYLALFKLNPLLPEVSCFIQAQPLITGSILLPSLTKVTGIMRVILLSIADTANPADPCIATQFQRSPSGTLTTTRRRPAVISINGIIPYLLIRPCYCVRRSHAMSWCAICLKTCALYPHLPLHLHLLHLQLHYFTYLCLYNLAEH
jgi:hypothetical protein